MKISRAMKQKWADLMLGDFTPHSMALGLAFGTFIAILPTFGFSFLLALLLVIIFPNINRPAMFFALLIWNPLVQIPIYALSLKLGSILFDGMPVVKYNIEILNQLYSFTRRFLISHIIVTLITTAFVYISSRYLLQKKNVFIPTTQNKTPD